MSDEQKTGFEAIEERNDTLFFMEICEKINQLTPRKYQELRTWIALRPSKKQWEQLMSS